MGRDKDKHRKERDRHRRTSKKRSSKDKRRKKKRRRSRSSDSSDSSDGSSLSGGSAGPPSPQHLLLAAAIGDRAQCRQLIGQGADVASADAEGTTALHEACRHGHLATVRLLLRRGADAGLGDARGDSPAHLAARHCHLDLLAALLSADRPPEIEAVNARGESVAQLAARAMDDEDVQSYKREARGQGEHSEGGQQRQHSPGLGGGDPDWQRRLAEELSGDETVGEDPWGAYGGGDWHADEYETAEEYAQRIWQEMQAHRRAQAQQARAAFTQRRKREEVQRDTFRAAAEAESRRILEEQRAQDAAWRAAVAEGQAGAKRASYEARWQFFVAKHPEAPIGYADVPWILAPEAATQEELQKVVLYGAAGPQEQRKRLRTELIRWHPDKFQARFARRLVAADSDRILARVVAVSQALNTIHSAIQQQRQQQQQGQ